MASAGQHLDVAMTQSSKNVLSKTLESAWLFLILDSGSAADVTVWCRDHSGVGVCFSFRELLKEKVIRSGAS